jgi:hypothetical protein
MDDNFVDNWEDIIVFPLVILTFFFGMALQLPFESIILIVIMLILLKIEYNTQRMRGFLKK